MDEVRRNLRAWTLDDVRALETEIPGIVAAPAEREAVERDFGQLVAGRSVAALIPRDADEVVAIVLFANERRLSITPRGRGMSQGGQTVAHDTVCVDFSRLDRVDAPDLDSLTMRCSAGASWRAAVARSAVAGLLPKVVPLNLDLTVGGLLSVAGVGASSHRYGLAVSTVNEIELVAGDGRRLGCRNDTGDGVYDAVLGGMGRAALLLSATLQLRPFAPAVRTAYLLFDSAEPWFAAQRTLAREGRADYLEAFCVPAVQGLRNGVHGRRPFARWFFGLHVTVEHEPGAAPDPATILRGLERCELVHLEDWDTVAFASRHDERFAAMRRSGAWLQKHPWVEAFLPAAAAEEILAEILARYPAVLGDGPRLLFVDPSNVPDFVALPDAEEIACLALLPAAIPPHMFSATLEAFLGIHHIMLEHGGKRVLSGWTTMMDDDALSQHYGARRVRLAAIRAMLDPIGVLDTPITASWADCSVATTAQTS
jgi:cytokinin dehydrogenase